MFGELMNMIGSQDNAAASRLTQRRKALLELIAQEYPDKNGIVFLCAPIELDHQSFVQDSSFFYLTGLSEPAQIFTFGFHEPVTLYTPDFADLREKWVHAIDVVNNQTKMLFGIDEIEKSGNRVAAYQIDPYFSESDYLVVIQYLKELVAQGQTIFTLYPTHSRLNAPVKIMIDRFAQFVPGLGNQLVDISGLVAKLRRKKDMHEIELMYQSIAITAAGFQAAGHLIAPGATESQVQAAIEYIFTENNAQKAYSTIVGSGKRATILHYHINNAQLEDGDLVLIDAGAMYQHYCADITRVFPVSGKFNKKQKKLYEIVLETQQQVAQIARPGMWICNPEHPEMSLQHIAVNHLKKYGYDKYFIHGIGHYLGLDVHDVGSRLDPLQEGDVITIEPGIYIPEESIGIRIEDNYWIVADAQPVCISEDIAKSVVEIEQMVQQSFE